MNQLYNVLIIKALIIVFPFSLPLKHALYLSNITLNDAKYFEKWLMKMNFYITREGGVIFLNNEQKILI